MKKVFIGLFTGLLLMGGYVFATTVIGSGIPNFCPNCGKALLASEIEIEKDADGNIIGFIGTCSNCGSIHVEDLLVGDEENDGNEKDSAGE